MATRSVNLMPSVSSTVAGQTASLKLIKGMTYERLMIEMVVDDGGTSTPVPENAWGTYLGEVRLIVDGDTKIQIDAADLIKLNKFHGQDAEAGVLTLFLSQPWARTPGGEDQTAYGTLSGINTFMLEMDIKPGVTVESLEVYALQSPGRPFGPHLRIQKHSHTQGITGAAEISDITRGPWVLKGIHFATDAIGKAEIKLDNRTVHKSSPAIRNSLARVVKKSPQSGFTHIDLMMQNRVSDWLPMAVLDFRLLANFTATGNFRFYTETVRAPD